MTGWADRIASLGATSDLLALLADPDDPQLQAEAERLFFLTLASGWFTAFADPDLPDFVPAVNTHLNCIGTNPDFIYGTAAIDGAGSYLLTGERGDGLFVMMDIAAGGLGVMEELGPSLGTLDFDTLTLDDQGRFSVLLSAEQPRDWTGDWYRLDPSARSLSLRQASYDWGNGRDARIAIERIEKAHRPRRWAAEDIAERLTALAAYPRRLSGMALGFIKAQRDKGLWNALEHDDWAGRGGVEGQHYYQGLFRLEAGKALLLETALPDRVQYWNVQLSDMMWNSIDWMNRQSSLNGGQARIDADGRFRAVIARDDPGVSNWLDPGGNSDGAIMLRWTGASSGPEPTLRLVDMADLRALLPSDTPLVTPEQREAQLRARRRGAQMRRRW
ncbi:MAG: DUF1214 domain-containing protein [Novosphingobium sp.]|nr:DUF1214 domain-containing protein [Novosphingobium sp.]MCP5380147.1 DUF1214 domain-containing protein [Novosphingobium sp.]MCP5388231.1 DUF1214 domain-containing protein [Novosphingobium sp.]